MHKKILMLLFFAIISGQFISANHIEGVNRDPDFIPQYDWSIRYIDLFKQAIKEKYGLDDTAIENNLIIISAANEDKIDGFAIPKEERNGEIRYVYKIDWVLSKGSVEFFVKDENGVQLSDEKIKNNMKSNLEKVFRIKSVISNDQAINSCDPSAEFRELEYPWYNNFNNIRLDVSTTENGGKLFFECRRTINDDENKCYLESFDLETGEKIISSDTPCRIYSEDSQNQLSVKNSNTLTKDLIYALIIAIVIFLFFVLIRKRKSP